MAWNKSEREMVDKLQDTLAEHKHIIGLINQQMLDVAEATSKNTDRITEIEKTQAEEKRAAEIYHQNIRDINTKLERLTKSVTTLVASGESVNKLKKIFYGGGGAIGAIFIIYQIIMGLINYFNP